MKVFMRAISHTTILIIV